MGAVMAERREVMLALMCALAVLSLAGCPSSSPSPARPPITSYPYPSGTPHGNGGTTHPNPGGSAPHDTRPAVPSPAASKPPLLLDQQVQNYVKACSQAVSVPAPAQLTYPASLALQQGQSITYTAHVDVRSSPAPVPPDTKVERYTGENIVVSCQLAARLVNVGRVTEVEDPNPSTGGWVLHRFDAFGALDWSWTVKAAGVGSGQLRLEMMPAAVEGTTVLNPQQNVLSRVTQVTVEGNWAEDAQTWFSRNTGPIKNLWIAVAGVVAALGGAYAAVAGWVTKHRGKLPWPRRSPTKAPSKASTKSASKAARRTRAKKTTAK